VRAGTLSPSHHAPRHFLRHHRCLDVVAGVDRVLARGRGALKHGALSLIALTAVLLAVGAVAAWDLTGGKLLVMETASMCPKVCVGAMLAERPVRGPLHVGELITFHPPSTLKETYTHEIWRIFPNGMVQTKGVANPNHDPWLITRSDIVGKAAFTVWGLGWVLKVLPFLAIGVALWVSARRWIAEKRRWEWDRTWMTALWVLPMWSVRPLVQVAVTGLAPDPAHVHWSIETVVNTGILPVAFSARGGQSPARVGATGVASVAGPPSRYGAPLLHEAVSLPWWGWAVLGIVVLSPMAGYLWHLGDGESGGRRSARSLASRYRLARERAPVHRVSSEHVAVPAGQGRAA